MNEVEVIVGVDVSQAQLDVALWPGGESFSLSNDVAGIKELLERLSEQKAQAVVVEASGVPRNCWSANCARQRSQWQWSTRARCVTSPAAWGSWPRPIALMRWCWRSSGRPRRATGGWC